MIFGKWRRTAGSTSACGAKSWSRNRPPRSPSRDVTEREHMKPDSMIVEPGHIANAGQQVVGEGAEQSLARLAEAEPALASYLRHCLTGIAGKLALSGAP